MIQFKSIELCDKPWIDACVMAENTRSADFNFANMFLWDAEYKQSAAKIGSRMAARLDYLDVPFFAYPVGTGDLYTAIEALREYAAAQEFPFLVAGVTEETRAGLEAVYPGKLVYTPEREYFDYVYEAERLATLSGKKLHAKRNHINRFLEENPDWHFELLTEELFPECRSMLASWTENHGGNEETAEGLSAEHTAIELAFRHYDVLGLEGGALFSGEKLIAFTIGEKISADTFDIHFEKAPADVQGAYPMINREFVRLILEKHPEIKYINREDDMGLDGLRKAKLSYDPAFLVEKYSAYFKDDGGNIR